MVTFFSKGPDGQPTVAEVRLYVSALLADNGFNLLEALNKAAEIYRLPVSDIEGLYNWRPPTD